jgi:hypothetical protein
MIIIKLTGASVNGLSNANPTYHASPVTTKRRSLSFCVPYRVKKSMR